eukprot:TRINITY_DN27461_c0_g1_i1.p1 TRINITY_DN27461_c0_g1~~TRINITY_DN27461_c0_g1_i1.p1  ORF type:complete len:314 (+),score=52.31 TRINITY_DN27461_c0_g1_i1:236-1177(+)
MLGFGGIAVCQLIPVFLTVLLVWVILWPGALAIGLGVGVLSSMLFPRSLHTWPRVIHAPMWRAWRRYFSFQVYAEVGPEFDPAADPVLAPDDKHIIVSYPHGLFPMAAWLQQSVNHRCFRSRYVKGCGASMIFRTPIVRFLFSWMGVIDASPKNVARQLDQYDVHIMPGGIAEMFIADPEKEKIYVSKHKGFCKVAISTGAHIVPSYSFGVTSIYDAMPQRGEGGTSIGKLLMSLSRKLRLGFVYLSGRCWIPIPFQHPIVNVLGRPIRVTQDANPSQDQVDALHAKVMQAELDLYKRYSQLIGWEHKPLQVL